MKANEEENVKMMTTSADGEAKNDAGWKQSSN